MKPSWGLYVCISFQLLNQFINFHKIRYKHYATGGHSKLVLD